MIFFLVDSEFLFFTENEKKDIMEIISNKEWEVWVCWQENTAVVMSNDLDCIQTWH